MYPQQHQSSQSRHSRRATSSQLVRAHNDPVNHPVSYAGTQVNLYGSVPPSTGHFPYNNYSYPPMGYAQANGVQLGLVTEHMLRKLDESRLMTMSELMRRAYGIPQQSGPYVQEPLTPRQAIENYPPKAKDVSPGHGDWKGQIEHIFAHLMEIAQEDRSFRRNIGEPLLGEIVSADLDEANDYYKLTLTFSRPTERKHSPISINRAKAVAMPHQPATSGRGLGSSSRRREVTSKVKEQLERDDQSQYEKENVKQEGTLKPYRQFSAEADAELLRKAMKGLGTDEDAVISVFGNRTNKQRQEVIKMYKTMFGKDLVKDLKSELNGDMWKTIKALCLPPADYDATELRNAIQGLGTDDSTVIEIICTRTSKSIQMLKESYKKLFNKSLEDDIAGDTSGHFKRLLTSLLQANRDDNNVIDRTLAKKEAKLLFDSGAKKWGTDESRFNAILVSRSQTQLRATFEEYYRLSGKSIEDAIKSEMSGDMASGLLTMVRCIQNKPRYFALQLYKSMKGVSTDDDALIRIIVSRCEIDMVQVKEEFQREYKQALGQFVASDTSGDYRNLLLSLIGETTAAKAADSASKKRRDDNSD